MHQDGIIAALQRPASDLGILPELAMLRPQLNVQVHDTLTSTNQTAWRLIEQGHGAGTVVIARQQSAGRGQWGRHWQSAVGGLYLSLVLEPEMAIAQATLLTLASAWGITTSLNNLGVPLQIKWPNDLIFQGNKVGGILTESRLKHLPASGDGATQSGIQYAVVGVGMNWDNPLPSPALSLRALLPDHTIPAVKDLETLAAIVMRGVLQGYYFYHQYGDLALIQAYQEKLAHLGRNIQVNGHSAVVQGVTLTGDLAVEINKGEQKTTQSLKPGEIRLGYNV